MNRAERRRLDRVVGKVNNPIYYKVTAEQLDRLKREITAEAQDRCIKLLFSIPMKVDAVDRRGGWVVIQFSKK